VHGLVYTCNRNYSSNFWQYCTVAKLAKNVEVLGRFVSMFVLLKCPIEVISKNVITPPELFNTKGLSTVVTFCHQGQIQDLRNVG